MIFDHKKLSEGLELIGTGFLSLAEAFGKEVSSAQEIEAAAPQLNNGAVKKEKVKKEKVETKAEAKTEEKEVKSEGKNEITEDMLRTALVEFATNNTKDKAYAILGKYGAKKVNELKKEDFPRVLAELEM